MARRAGPPARHLDIENEEKIEFARAASRWSKHRNKDVGCQENRFQTWSCGVGQKNFLHSLARLQLLLRYGLRSISRVSGYVAARRQLGSLPRAIFPLWVVPLSRYKGCRCVKRCHSRQSRVCMRTLLEGFAVYRLIAPNLCGRFKYYWFGCRIILFGVVV